MIYNLFLTADLLNAPTGGGLVARNESQALSSLGECVIWDRESLQGGSDPWGWDTVASTKKDWFVDPPKLCHIYSGSFTNTVKALKRNGCIVTWSVVAHDKDISREEHEKLGLEFPYTHLTDPILWERYSEGYRLADVIFCPGQRPKEINIKYGCKNRIEVIPHGCDLPTEVKPLPKHFTCGYLGAFGLDKGVRYLLEAWKNLNYRDATLLLGGHASNSDWVRQSIRNHGGGNIQLVGWINNISDFYNRLSCYIQPSATEGFGLEVLEAQAHRRLVICSEGAGASDLVPIEWRCKECSVDALARLIDDAKKLDRDSLNYVGITNRRIAEHYTWDKIRERYLKVWRELMCH